MTSKVKFDLGFVINNLDYPGIHVNIASNNHFGGLWGHYDLQMASEVKSDLRFELSDLNFIGSNVYIIILFLKKSIWKEDKKDMLTCVLRRRQKIRWTRGATAAPPCSSLISNAAPGKERCDSRLNLSMKWDLLPRQFDLDKIPRCPHIGGDLLSISYVGNTFGQQHCLLH